MNEELPNGLKIPTKTTTLNSYRDKTHENSMTVERTQLGMKPSKDPSNRGIEHTRHYCSTGYTNRKRNQPGVSSSIYLMGLHFMVTLPSHHESYTHLVGPSVFFRSTQHNTGTEVQKDLFPVSFCDC